MEDFLDKKMTLGSFAKLHNVNKKTLIYYDEIGFFSPSLVADNGYRYYDFRQNFTFTIINLLRRMKVSLTDIKLLLELYDHGSLLLQIYKKSSVLERQLFELLALYNASKDRLFSAEPVFLEADGKDYINEKEMGAYLKNEEPLISRFMEDCYQYRLYLEIQKSEKCDKSTMIL